MAGTSLLYTMADEPAGQTQADLSVAAKSEYQLQWTLSLSRAFQFPEK